MAVEWRKIKYKGIKLAVSDTGRVRYCGISIKQHQNSGGYLYVCLKAQRLLVHHLVCKAFKRNYTYKCVINHLDTNKKNNHASNLKCGTQLDNVKHAHELDLFWKGRRLWKDVTHSIKKW